MGTTGTRNRAGDDWDSFQDIFTDSNAFAIAHGKPWMVVEFGAQEDPAVPGRKAQWLLDALATAKSWPSLKALIYFDVDKDGYPWVTDSSASAMAAYRQIALDPYLNPTSTLPVPSPVPSPTPTPRPSPTPTPRPSPTPTPRPSPTPTPRPSPTPTPTPSPSPTPTPTPTPTPPPIQPGELTNTFNDGVAGEPSGGWISGSSEGSPFDRIVDNNGSITLDDTHTRGPGLAVKHEVGYGGNSYYGWGSSFSWAPIWYGRVYVWFDSLPDGGARLIRVGVTARCGSRSTSSRAVGSA